MNIGMLWIDTDIEADLNARIERAVEYYQDKFYQSPDICYVHPCVMPDDLGERSLKVNCTEVRTCKELLPNNFWVGVSGTKRKEGYQNE